MNFYREPTEETVLSIIKEITERHPCSSCFSIGKSVLGRKIPVLTVGNRQKPVLFVAATHGSEWLTALCALRFFEEVCEEAEKKGMGSLCRRGLAVIPVLNPDGVEINLKGSASAREAAGRVERLSGGDSIHWNANARGVDLNHNFDAGWNALQVMERKAGIKGPSPRQYGGPCPFSEPESRAVADFCRSFCVERLYALHSQGEEIYWYYGPKTPFQSREIARELAELSGYTVAMPEGLASHGGLKDWFIETFGKPGFTVELGRGENPLPLSDFEKTYTKARPLFQKALVL